MSWERQGAGGPSQLGAGQGQALRAGSQGRQGENLRGVGAGPRRVSLEVNEPQGPQTGEAATGLQGRKSCGSCPRAPEFPQSRLLKITALLPPRNQAVDHPAFSNHPSLFPICLVQKEEAGPALH